MMGRAKGSVGSEAGFSLLELLVALAIIALVAALAAPNLAAAMDRSRKARGQADLQTIAAALERHYVEHGAYPARSAKAALTDGYMKQSTAFQNGFAKGYIYLTDKSGEHFVLVDPRNNRGAVQVVCGDGWTSEKITIGKDLTAKYSAASLSDKELAAGCTLRAWDDQGTGGAQLDAWVVTSQ